MNYPSSSETILFYSLCRQRKVSRMRTPASVTLQHWSTYKRHQIHYAHVKEPLYVHGRSVSQKVTLLTFSSSRGPSRDHCHSDLTVTIFSKLVKVLRLSLNQFLYTYNSYFNFKSIYITCEATFRRRVLSNYASHVQVLRPIRNKNCLVHQNPPKCTVKQIPAVKSSYRYFVQQIDLQLPSKCNYIN